MSNKKKDTLFWGIVLIIIGLFFLLDNLGFNFNVWHILTRFWPVILIIIGIKGILSHYQKEK